MDWCKTSTMNFITLYKIIIQWCSWIDDYKTLSIELHNRLARGKKKLEQVGDKRKQFQAWKWQVFTHNNCQH